MKPIVLSALRSTVFATTLFAASAFAPAPVAASEPAPADPVARTLAASGVIPLVKATTWTRDSFNGHIDGPEVPLGFPQSLVRRILGDPTAALADGTLLYRDFATENSSAQGTLVVRFAQHRVSQLFLVSPAVATALLTTPAGNTPVRQIASK